jgi:hypothetical protein
MATYTSTIYANQQPKANHTGNHEVQGTITFPAASSAGDVAFLCKIPYGARIIDIKEYHTTGATAQVVSVGLARGYEDGGGSSLSCYLSQKTQGTEQRLTWAALPSRVSGSASDPLSFGILAAKVESGSATTSLKINFSVEYRIDEPA